MSFDPICKDLQALRVTPNLADYNQARAAHSWDAIRAELQGLPGGGLNIAHEAVDRHARGTRAAHLALRWLGKDGSVHDLTYADMADHSARFANVLRTLGVGKGERVFALMSRVPELYFAALGTLKNVSVFCPLFSQFGPEPVWQRLSRGDAKVLVTTKALYEKKVASLRERLPSLQFILLADAEDDLDGCVRSWPKLMAAASTQFEIPPTSPEDMALLHFTSGTTGMPKGAVHVHQAALTHFATGRYVLDLHPEDIFWCTADPGWVTGTSYGIFAPLLHGVTNLVDEADFDAERWYCLLQDQKVTVWYTAPTAIRRLMRIPGEPRQQFDLGALRLIHSVGEPLNPEAVVWGQCALGLPIHDNWWQTETGGIMIANYAAMDIRPGSMGKPLPGIEAAIVKKGDAGVEVITECDVEGELALKPGWPSMFRAYLHDEARYAKCFVDGWYLSGDLAKRDADGYFWFVGRADDIIKTSGHMVGPFEVESALMEHPSVAESGVIGKPDPLIGQLVKAFVVVKAGHEGNDALRMDLIGFARKRLGPAVAPKEIAFVESLPKTRSGKIMRRLLKARELGLPEGDLSTLEND
ncbi:acetate--CoA ligase [Prosthecobacter sp.]|uniref:acetate--CoA ligase n=1 Tax=Prosthecobacter sp. TaxID=1965333 RepID=UPI001D4F5FFB|nr:acetate--CoA ligase [Prosthecobacter sp.]MCB1279257.1 acetate--CoA ligase [Prosthecobacter sp.]